MRTLALEDVQTHEDVPYTEIDDYATFKPLTDLGVSKYRALLPRDVDLEALFLNKKSDILVVTFHGATTREKKLPRFEWFRTLRKNRVQQLVLGGSLSAIKRSVGACVVYRVAEL